MKEKIPGNDHSFLLQKQLFLSLLSIMKKLEEEMNWWSFGIFFSFGISIIFWNLLFLSYITFGNQFFFIRAKSYERKSDNRKYDSKWRDVPSGFKKLTAHGGPKQRTKRKKGPPLLTEYESWPVEHLLALYEPAIFSLIMISSLSPILFFLFYIIGSVRWNQLWKEKIGFLVKS